MDDEKQFDMDQMGENPAEHTGMANDYADEECTDSLSDTAAFKERQNPVLPVTTINRLICQKLKNIPSDLEQAKSRQMEICDILLQFHGQPNQKGDADDFITLAESLAKEDEYSLACEVLDEGLMFFPKNAGMLTAYLKYGIKCGKFEITRTRYKSLLRRPQTAWSVQTLLGLADYLVFRIENAWSDSETQELKEETETVFQRYHSSFPADENAFFLKSKVYRASGSRQEEEQCLQTACNELEWAPCCSLRLAELLLEKGYYKEAQSKLQRVLLDWGKASSNISEAYVYYLLGICEISLLKRETSPDRRSEIVYSVLDKFGKAMLKNDGLNEATLKDMKVKTVYMAQEYGVNA